MAVNEAASRDSGSRRPSLAFLYSWPAISVYLAAALLLAAWLRGPAPAEQNAARPAQLGLVATIDPTTHWQPSLGTIRIFVEDVTGAAVNIAGKQVQVEFRWHSTPESPNWFYSPDVRIEPVTNTKRLVVSAKVPGMGVPPGRAIDGAKPDVEGRSSFFGLVPEADVRITVAGVGGGSTDYQGMRTIGVTNALAALATAIIVIALLTLFLRVVRPSTLRGTNLVLQLIETKGARASLSQFQIMLWTLLIGGAVTYVMVLSGNLIPITKGTLVLLGISGVATLTSLMAQGAQGEAAAPPPVDRKPLWRDLIAGDGEIEVTRVQMLFFTVLVAAFVLIHVLDNYEIPEIDESFLALMGISNGVYVLNKFVKAGNDDSAAAAGAKETSASPPSEDVAKAQASAATARALIVALGPDPVGALQKALSDAPATAHQSLHAAKDAFDTATAAVSAAEARAKEAVAAVGDVTSSSKDIAAAAADRVRRARAAAASELDRVTTALGAFSTVQQAILAPLAKG